jgi:hypothetical protein
MAEEEQEQEYQLSESQVNGLNFFKIYIKS